MVERKDAPEGGGERSLDDLLARVQYRQRENGLSPIPLSFRRAAQAYTRVADEVLRKVGGLSSARFTILAALEVEPGLPGNVLAELTGQRPPSLADTVQSLERDGLLERRQGHRRQRLHYLTSAGADLLPEANAALGRLHETLLSGIGTSDRFSIEAGLRTFLQAIDATQNPTGPHFAYATSSDIPDLASLINRSYSVEGADQGWVGGRDFQTGERITTKDLTDLFEHERHFVPIVRMEGTIVACCVLEVTGSDVHLSLLAVDPHKQGSGLGKRLLQQAEMISAERLGAKNINLEVVDHHKPLRAWYERLGYTATGKTEPLAQTTLQEGTNNIPPARLVHMRKNIADR